MIQKISIVFIWTATQILCSCQSLIEVDPPRTALIKRIVFEDEVTASAAISGLYSKLSIDAGSQSSITYLAALSSDELTLNENPIDRQLFDNSIAETNSRALDLWRGCYERIYLANSIIEGLEDSQIEQSAKAQLTGEALFIRAFTHFYLVNMFGDVPYITSTGYENNSTVARQSTESVYKCITDDVTKAYEILANDYSFSKGERIRVNRHVADAFLARIHLFTGNWEAAELHATNLIENTNVFQLVDLQNVFLKNSMETIWQLMPIGNQMYTNDGATFSRSSYALGLPVLTSWLWNTFEKEDNRRSVWIGSGTSGSISWHYPAKYRATQANATGLEYSTVFRLAEVHLIRAEARLRLGKLTGEGSAQQDINTIRLRAGLKETTATSESELITAIEHERRVELFTEWGHRWLDLKRTGKTSAALESIKPDWQNTDALYPIPQAERLLNPNIKPNPGY